MHFFIPEVSSDLENMRLRWKQERFRAAARFLLKTLLCQCIWENCLLPQAHKACWPLLPGLPPCRGWKRSRSPPEFGSFMLCAQGDRSPKYSGQNIINFTEGLTLPSFVILTFCAAFEKVFAYQSCIAVIVCETFLWFAHLAARSEQQCSIGSCFFF